MAGVPPQATTWLGGTGVHSETLQQVSLGMQVVLQRLKLVAQVLSHTPAPTQVKFPPQSAAV
jgi:hypothetical protein